jgi:Ethanolamine utilization protein EutJ (predicted chaperonin)
MAITHVRIRSGVTPALDSLVVASGAYDDGNTLVATVVLNDSAVAVSTWTDDAVGDPIAMTFVDAFEVTGLRVELWRSNLGGSKAGGSFLRANFDGSCHAAIRVLEKAGVAGFGIFTKTNNTNADPTLALTTQDNDNVVCAGFGSVGATLPTAKTGTFRSASASSGASPVVCSMNDNTSATPASVTNAVTLAATTWAAVALELRSTVGGATAVPLLTNRHRRQVA